MGGQVLFHDALAARLELIKPSRMDIENCLKKHPLQLTQGVKEFISKLHGKGIPVYLVSGGFRQVYIVNIQYLILFSVVSCVFIILLMYSSILSSG